MHVDDTQSILIALARGFSDLQQKIRVNVINNGMRCASIYKNTIELYWILELYTNKFVCYNFCIDLYNYCAALR